MGGGFRVQGSGFRVQGSGSGVRLHSCEARADRAPFEVQGSGFGVWYAGRFYILKGVGLQRHSSEARAELGVARTPPPRGRPRHQRQRVPLPKVDGLVTQSGHAVGSRRRQQVTRASASHAGVRRSRSPAPPPAGDPATNPCRKSTDYGGTLPIRNCFLLGPYSRTIPRVIWWS